MPRQHRQSKPRKDSSPENAQRPSGSTGQGRAEAPTPADKDTPARDSTSGGAAHPPAETPKPFDDLGDRGEAAGAASTAAPHALPSAGDDDRSMPGSLTGSSRMRSPGAETSSKSQRRGSGSTFAHEAVPEPSEQTPVTIVYTRRVVRGQLRDFGIKIQGVDCAWSTVVEAPGNEHILTGSSRDQVVIKRLRDCNGTVFASPEA